MNTDWLGSSKLHWAARAGAALLVGGATVVFTPVSAEAPVQADSSLFSEVQANRGGAVFVSDCAVCHGSELTGGGGSPPLKGPDFLFGWSQKTTKDLVDYIADNMPPGQGRSLAGQEYEDVAAFILRANGFSAGQSPLTSATSKPIGQSEGPAPVAKPASPPPAILPADGSARPPVPEGQEQAGSVNADAVYYRAVEARRALLARMSSVTDAMLANPADGDWLTWRRTYAGLGFSPLREINRTNAGKLATAWSWSLPVSPNAITPLAHDGVLFVYSANRVQALDGINGDLLWQYTRALPPALGGGVGYSLRNIAIFEDKLFVPTADGHMVALDAKTGKVVWDQKIVPDDASGVRLTGGPTVVRGKVIQGTTTCFTYKGGCFISALDARTGAEVWRFNTIARPGEPGGDTWNGAPLDERYGGAVWTSGSYDPELNLYYIGTGQTYDTGTLLQPRSDSSGQSADALYTDTTLALDPDTGKLKWHYQHFQRDVWDLDWAFERSLLTLNIGGRPRKISLTAGKLGIFDAVDRTNGQYLFSRDVGLQTLVSSIDPKTGIKHVNPALLPEGGVAKPICPHAGGARSWPATAVDPVSKIAYVPLVESCMDFTWTPRDAARTAAGGMDIRWELKARPDSDGRFGQVQAINVETGKVLWANRRRAPQSSSILATGGGLVFEGGRDRRFRALDNATGKTLWETRLSGVPSSTPITYSAGGRQYVAVVAGGGNAHDATWPILTPDIENPQGATTLWIFALPESRPR